MEAQKDKKDMSTDYTVQELLERLMQDESWEEDIEYRKKAIGMLCMSIFPVC